ncbi:GIP [Symbiodinium pilosum]|uniref:GIP protein n=1 Tax=Symbiodinium pilosum TaxID=2952 RepID=A0A812WU33_SYMPI|nr:GIP [Symbiodinium pilosum]
MGKVERAVELVNLEGSVTVYFDEPEKQTKIWSIERQLENSSMVVYLDADMTIHPDSIRWGLVPLLLSHTTWIGDVFVRDSWPGTECLNSGFVALRKTRAARLFLRLWEQKVWWPVSWDQSALAESVLELIGMEVEKYGNRTGYRSQCMRYLFPIPFLRCREALLILVFAEGYAARLPLFLQVFRRFSNSIKEWPSAIFNVL